MGGPTPLEELAIGLDTTLRPVKLMLELLLAMFLAVEGNWILTHMAHAQRMQRLRNSECSSRYLRRS